MARHKNPKTPHTEEQESGEETIKRGRGAPTKFCPEWAIKLAVYLVRNPHATKKQCQADLGINAPLDIRWYDTQPLWRYAREYAEAINKKRATKRDNFETFVISRMAPEHAALYEKLVFFEDNPQEWEVHRSKLDKMGDMERKRMFVQAMAANAFTMGKACKVMGISRDTADRWAETSQGFRGMLRQLEALKKDFFEEALVDLVAQRDSPAVIFANKTLNRDRGYGEKLSVDVKGQVDHKHTHTVVPLQALEGLPTETLELILQAVQSHKAKQMAAQAAGPGILTLPGSTGGLEGVDPAVVDVEELPKE